MNATTDLSRNKLTLWSTSRSNIRGHTETFTRPTVMSEHQFICIDYNRDDTTTTQTNILPPTTSKKEEEGVSTSQPQAHTSGLRSDSIPEEPKSNSQNTQKTWLQLKCFPNAWDRPGSLRWKSEDGAYLHRYFQRPGRPKWITLVYTEYGSLKKMSLAGNSRKFCISSRETAKRTLKK